VSISSPSLSSAQPVVNTATEPASIRNGDQAAKNAYAEGSAFEQMLLNQLTQTMSDTISGSGDSSDGLGGTSDGSDSSSSSGSPLGAYSSMLPSALTTGIMENGGTGVAMQIAEALDPSLANPTSTAGGQPTTNGGAGLTAPGTSTGTVA
jgi:hypothetical protein